MRGWIKLNRSITKHWVWTEEPFTKGQAWVDLLLWANHEPKDKVLKGKLIHVKRGQQIRSEITLSEKWQWSRGKVRRFLKLLVKEEMIVHQKDNLTSYISICNYNDYQDINQEVSTPDGTALDTPDGHQTDIRRYTVKNVKNEKKSNGEDSPQPKTTKFIPPTVEEVQTYIAEKGYSINAQSFVDYYSTSGWMRGKNKIKDWKACVRTWVKNSNSNQQSSSSENHYL